MVTLSRGYRGGDFITRLSRQSLYHEAIKAVTLSRGYRGGRFITRRSGGRGEGREEGRGSTVTTKLRKKKILSTETA